MTMVSRVVWSEGMFLRPQHFQQQERFLLHHHTQSQVALSVHAWGVRFLQWEHSLLRLGQLALSQVAALFPDGTWLASPEDEPLPSPIQVPQDTRDQLVYLALPVERPHAANIGERDDGKLTRYVFDDCDITDTTLGGENRDVVQMARLSPVLLLENQERAGFVCIAVARIVEVSEDGELRLDRRFVPPSLSVRDNAVLTGHLQELQGMIAQRAEAIAARLCASHNSNASVADYLMLQVLNRYEGRLRHWQGQAIHPFTLYGELVGLVGELATFSSTDKRMPEFPGYQHDQLTMVFSSVMSLLGRALSTVLEQTATALPLVEAKFGVRVASLPDKNLLDDAYFVLTVKADISADELRQRLPGQIKLGPVELIRDLVNNQLPGIDLTALPMAPRQVPYHAGHHYYQLEKGNDYWRKLKQSGGLAIHLSGNYPGLQLALWAVRH